MKWLLLISAMLIVSIPAINGETSIGGGPSVSVSEKSSAQGAFMTDGSDSKSLLTADAVKQIYSLLWVRNARGDYVEHLIRVDNGVDVSYYQYGSGPGDVAGTDYVYREETLNVDSADYIEAYVWAANLAGDEAWSSIQVSNGYLIDYFNSGFAGPFPPWGAIEGAFAAQSFGDAAGDEIYFDSYGKDSDGDYGLVHTEVYNGELWSDNYNRDGCLEGRCYGSVSAGHEQPDGHGEAGTMLYGGHGRSLEDNAPISDNAPITQVMYASNQLGDECIVGTVVNHGSFTNAGYSLWAYSITDQDITRAVQYIDASSSGAGNYIEEFAWLNTDNWDINYYDEAVRFWDESLISPSFTGITHGYW